MSQSALSTWNVDDVVAFHRSCCRRQGDFRAPELHLGRTFRKRFCPMNRQLDYNRLRFIQMQKRQRAVAKQILSDEVRMLNEVQESGAREGVQEFARGGFHGAKWVVSALLGKQEKNAILNEIRRETGKPIPHIVGMAQDGNRYGFDSDAG